MRIKLTYEKIDGSTIKLPVQYNYVIQSLIYNTFSKVLASQIHNDGFAFEKRKFKLFTFSRILEKGIKEGDRLEFSNSISFYFSSPKLEIIEDLGSEAIKKQSFNLINQQVILTKIEIVIEPTFESELLMKTLAPLVVYSTLKTEDGRKKLYYYRPNDKDFSKLIESNAIKKYIATYGQLEAPFRLSIIPHRFSIKNNLSVLIFRGTPIEAYTGIFKLSGSKELIKLVYDTGLGDKNSEGFGMWEIWKGGENA